MQRKSVIVGMSGGVDSSYAAALLKQQGYSVIGVMLNLWTEPSQSSENRCCSLDSQYVARRIASKLDIPFYVIDAKEEFRHSIVEMFINDYLDGKTPNPCVACNVKVRWKILLEMGDKLSIELLATGHYARIIHLENGHVHLLKGVDNTKEQSYVLSMLGVEYLNRTILPLGSITKEQVRNKSRDLDLQTHNRPDSQDLCFLGDLDYRQFLLKYAKDKIIPGEIVDEGGHVIGMHDGLPFYTIGQRKGLRIAYNQPLYVMAKDQCTNRLVVGFKFAKKNTEFLVKNINWIIKPSEGKDLTYNIKVRYKSRDVPAIIHSLGSDIIKVTMNSDNIPDIVPGQVAAIYSDELCIGGGIIV